MRFTVFTPCYNSEQFLHRVLESLEAQEFRDFEWLVINDASRDGTKEVIEQFISVTEIPVNFIDRIFNLGLHANINEAISHAKGEYIVLFGHDDRMMPNALKVFDQMLTKYPEARSVYALAQDQDGFLVGKRYPKDELISTYWEQFFDNENEEEKFQCWHTESLRKLAPLPLDQDEEQPGAWLWGKFGANHKSVFVNIILRVYYTNVSTQITANLSRDKKPNMIFNYYLTWVNEFQYQIKNKKRRYRGVAACVAYGLRANLSLGDILDRVEKKSNKLLCILSYPIALFFNYRNS